MKQLVFNNRILQIIYDFGLQNELMYIVNSNQSNYLPYHNLRHTLNVFECCYDIYSKYFNYDVPYKACRDLLIAALFHDFNHSGGLLEDSINVQIAILNMKNHFKGILNEEHIDAIGDILNATKYPYENDEFLTIRQMVIRDADLAQAASSDFIYFVCGLFEENKSIASIKTVIKSSIEFNKSNRFILKESIDLYEEKRQQNIVELEKILKMYEW